MGQNNELVSLVALSDGPGGASPPGKTDAWERTWHPDCAVCSTAVCLRRGVMHLACAGCHAVEAGVERGREALHAGQCLIIWTKARAVETVAALINDVAAGLRVWRDRDHIPLTEAQLRERAVNIVTGLVGNYDIVPIARTPVDFSAKEIDGRPVGHSWSCRCDRCADFHLKIKERV